VLLSELEISGPDLDPDTDTDILRGLSQAIEVNVGTGPEIMIRPLPCILVLFLRCYSSVMHHSTQ
jgi:hypothetical protein